MPQDNSFRRHVIALLYDLKYLIAGYWNLKGNNKIYRPVQSPELYTGLLNYYSIPTFMFFLHSHYLSHRNTAEVFLLLSFMMYNPGARSALFSSLV